MRILSFSLMVLLIAGILPSGQSAFAAPGDETSQGRSRNRRRERNRRNDDYRLGTGDKVRVTVYDEKISPANSRSTAPAMCVCR